METKLLNGNNKEAIAEASKILQDGGLVAFPTETVYGLGADALKMQPQRSTLPRDGQATIR